MTGESSIPGGEPFPEHKKESRGSNGPGPKEKISFGTPIVKNFPEREKRGKTMLRLGIHLSVIW